MVFEKPSAPKLVQSFLRGIRDQQLKRKSYRYYPGYQQLKVTVQDGSLMLSAKVEQQAEGLSVLHGRNIVMSVPVRTEQTPVNSQHANVFTVSGTIALGGLLDQWEAYRERVAQEADEQDTEPELSEDSENSELDDVSGLASGTVRFAFSLRTEFDSMPTGIAWIQLTDDGELLRRKEVQELIESGDFDGTQPVIAHRIVGRFAQTSFEGHRLYSEGERSAGVYINKKSELALGINRPVDHKYRIRTDTTQVADGILSLSGILETQTDRLDSASLQVIGRRSSAVFESPVALTMDSSLTERRFGRAMYSWDTALNFATSDWSEIDRGDNYDLYLVVNVTGVGEPVRIRVTRTPFIVRSTTNADAVTVGEKTLAISPYFTFKAKSTSLTLEVFDKDAFAVLEQAKQRSFPIRESGKAPVWIVGELAYKAQDNGLHLFRYLRANRPDIDAYYAIDEDSPDLRNFETLDHVVFHGSKEHFELALRAERFIGTHHADYLYPTRHHAFSSRSRATRVFLQHGVMGTKWMVPNYGKNSPGFATDLFMVSSEREKQYIVSDFLYQENEVKVTGLSRFDSLLAGDIPVNENMLLIIPTWRDWLQNEEAFLESDYLEQWKTLLNSPELARMVKDYNLEVVFSLHPNMMQFREHFRDAPARLIVQGEVDVQELIKTAAVMVTDYSSVNFDFSFLHRPVHYFQFDRARFLGRNGSHLDLDNELPGKIAFDAADLLADLENTLTRGKSMEDQYRRRADIFITHRDRNNSQRVTAEIEKASLRQRANEGWQAELPVRLQNRFRRNKYYFSIMRAMSKAMKLVPADEELIVFESGLGKQYGDSPRYIYEELLRQGDKRTKVWIYTGRHRFTDPNTKVVKRLSPEYFWYLARAKYWVNNQSFPHYLRRRKDGIFLQTWHGTPLKQMAMDIDEVQGRDEGYLERVVNATKQWTHLISPSSYTSRIMRSAYGFSGAAVELGYPRNDILVGEHVREHEAHVRESLGLRPAQKTVLYAPTFRDDAGNGKGRFRFELPLNLEEFNTRFGDDTVLLLRMHVLVSNAVVIPEELRGRVIDVSGYADIQELYLATDVLVTDYSSVFFDYSILRRPIVFYAYDLANYRDNLRGFYLDYETALPGPIVETEEELWNTVSKALAGTDIGGVDREKFIADFAPNDDGLAARRVVDRFFK
ncbi:CDP-glycerol glycerophosphotransferase family protein [Glutamicibacter sp. NPDC087344]|uniref:CDP-glycerol glycerophosphotransferase family protein n=1 Tax=Glutamicibacter sp. NPDC087344 TaxID=3363994 RepID=UPI0037F9600F